MYNNWESLYKNLKLCKKCSLCKNRTQVLCGYGNKNSKLMIIAEAPGYTEDQTGVPFTGKSGIIFDKILKELELQKEDVYTTNIVKCHPDKNRNPSIEERECCIKWLRNEIYLLRPKFVLILGKVAAERLIHPNFKILSEHGKIFERNNYIFIATFHPSAVLRDESKLETMISDIKTLKKEINKVKIH